MTKVNLTPERDLDKVAQVAFEISEKLREQDLGELNNQLVSLCRWYPARAAQVMTCLAAWLDPETPTATLWDRVEAITQTRTEAHV